MRLPPMAASRGHLIMDPGWHPDPKERAKKNAEKVELELIRRGYKPFMINWVSRKVQAWWAVRFGPYEKRLDAEELVQYLKKDEGINCYVVDTNQEKYKWEESGEP